MQYAGSMCIETPPFAHASGGDYPAEAWRQMVEDTARLAADALGEG
jgi:hypothetical protein